MRTLPASLIICSAAALAVPLYARDPSGDGFNRNVAPILMKRCLECHSGAEASGKLDLTSAKGIDQGGDSGPAIAAGKPEESLLLRRIRDGEMPPAKQGKSQRVSREEVAAVRQWIAD